MHLLPPRRPSASPRRHRSTRRIAGVSAVLIAVAAACVPATEDLSNDGTPVRAPEAVRGPAAGPVGTAPAGSYVSAGARAGIGDCPIYPVNNAFHADITSLAVSPNSGATIAAAGAGLSVRTAHSNVYMGSRGGIPVNVVDSRSTPMTNVRGGLYAYQSDLLNHPIPSSARLEGYPGIAWDRHLLLFDVATCSSHEFFWVTPPSIFLNMWSADMAATLDLTSNAMRTRGTATASGTSMLAGMIRYDEVAAGRVDHTIGITLPTISSQPALWPAQRTDGRSNDPNAPRMGTWLRLRSDVDLSGLGPDARAIATALQVHGAVVTDTGSEKVGLNAENDGRWRDGDLATLERLKLSDFEVVDASPMKVADGSYEIR